PPPSYRLSLHDALPISAVGGAVPEDQPSVITHRPDRAAGAQAERRRPPRHPREVAHQGALHLGIVLIPRFLQPGIETLLQARRGDRKSTRLNSSHVAIS